VGTAEQNRIARDYMQTSKSSHCQPGTLHTPGRLLSEVVNLCNTWRALLIHQRVSSRTMWCERAWSHYPLCRTEGPCSQFQRHVTFHRSSVHALAI